MPSLVAPGLVVGGAVSCLLGCVAERDPASVVCPTVGGSAPLAAGDLVISEIRGPQSGGDTYGEWIEVMARTARNVAPGGLEIRLLRIDGGDESSILVRRDDLAIDAGGYFTVGDFPSGDEPAHVDYGFAPALTGSIYDRGALELYACGTLIDRVVYRDLPDVGTWSFGGTLSATENDDESAWCVDAADEDPDPTELGVRGTPQEANRPCPAR